MQALAEAAWKRMGSKQLKIGEMKPEIIENPTPSPVVEVNDPYADIEA